MPKGTLFDCEELHKSLGAEDLFIIDTRNEMVYNRAHIPGAVNINEIFTYLCLSENGGYAAMVDFFEKKLAEKGLKKTDRVVIYEDAMDNGYGQSCRGWFLLSYLGHPQVYVLHGGFRAWKAKNLPLTADPVIRPASDFKAQPNQDMVVTTEQMLKAIDDPEILILDVRDYAEWNGANSSPYGYDYCPRMGHIPNARWIEWYRLMLHRSGIPYFKSVKETLAVAETADITPATKVYLYCFKGARTSNTMMALRNAGIKNVSNYFMSWNEWSRHFELPIVEGFA
jgi:thiosulfate/3-mercaptopyruvate sulfurtransferase